MWGFFFIFFCFMTILPLTIFLHELGHFFLAYICNGKNITVTIGVGKRLGHFKWKNGMLIVKKFPFGGNTTYELTMNKKLERFFISVGGPLLNGMVAFFLLLPGFGSGVEYMTIWFQWLAIFNLWMFVFNIVPYKLKTYYSDGWLALQALKN